MQHLTEICLRRPVFATTLILLMLVAGMTGYMRLGVDRFPGVDLPTVEIRTHLDGTSAEDMELQVTHYIEEAVSTIEGINELRSISAPGTSHVSVIFELERDIDVAAQDVRDRVSLIQGRLPRDTDPPQISKLDNDQMPVLTLALFGQRNIREITEIADKVIKPRLDGTPGVGAVDIIGGLERSINIWVDAERLAAYNLPVTVVRDVVAMQNVDRPGGYLSSAIREETIRTLGQMTEASQFNDLVLSTVNDRIIRISDIGYAEDGVKEQRSIARYNQEPAVLLEIRRQSGANTLQVIEGVRERVQELQAQLPSNVALEVVSDQSAYINLAMREIHLHLVLGSLLACLVVYIFLRNYRAIFVAGLAIPVSLISTFAMMWLMGFSMNSVTMLALVLMVGVVIDDSIVVLENTFRHAEELGEEPVIAARNAVREIGLAVTATTFSLIAIFVPVSLMSSISGRFLFQFGLTCAVACLASLFIAFTLSPVLSAKLLKQYKKNINTSEHSQNETTDEKPGTHVNSRKGLYGLIEFIYMAILRISLRWRLAVVVLAVGVILSAWPLYQRLPQEYLPTGVDEGEFEVVIRTPEGVSVPAMEQVMHTMEDIIMNTSGVYSSLTSIGEHLSRSGSLNQTRAFVHLHQHEERRPNLRRFVHGLLRGDVKAAFRGNYTQTEVMDTIRTQLQTIPDVRVSVRNLRRFNIGGTADQIDFNILGPELPNLMYYAQQLLDQSDELGLMNTTITLQMDRPELRVVVDRERAGMAGVTMEDIAESLRVLIGGDEQASIFRDPATNEDYDVQVRLLPDQRTRIEDISRIFVPTNNGTMVRLDGLVDIERVMTASRIDRLDRQRQVSLRGEAAHGYGLADRIEALEQAARALGMPQTYSTQVTGGAREYERTYREFMWALILSILLVYIIMAMQFDSFMHPLTILLSLPLTIPFALLTLWLTGQTLNLYSALGMLVLFGVTMKNAILQIDRMKALREQGLERLAAVLEGNRTRLRPILMTTFTFVAGMLPLVVGMGPGAEERRAVAVVIIGGQSMALFITLMVTPVMYTYLDDLKKWLLGRT